MKKIIFVLLLLPTILSAQTKLYKAGGFVYVEDSKITAFNPAQSSYYLLESKCVIRDNVNEIHKNLIYGEITDSSGVYYMTKQEVSLFLQKNLNQAVNLLINDEIVDSDNPLAIVDYDPNSRVSLNTVFGDKVTGIRKTDIAAQFQYGVEDGTSDTELENGGTVSINESMLVISSGINPDARARIQSTETVRL